MTVEHAVESQSQVRVPNEKTKGTRTAVPTPALRISTGVYSTTGRLHTCSWSYLNLVRGGTGGGVMVGSKWRTSSPSRVASDARPTKSGVVEACIALLIPRRLSCSDFRVRIVEGNYRTGSAVSSSAEADPTPTTVVEP